MQSNAIKTHEVEVRKCDFGFRISHLFRFLLETEGKTGTLVRRLVQVCITIGAGVTMDQTCG